MQIHTIENLVIHDHTLAQAALKTALGNLVDGFRYGSVKRVVEVDFTDGAQQADFDIATTVLSTLEVALLTIDAAHQSDLQARRGTLARHNPGDGDPDTAVISVVLPRNEGLVVEIVLHINQAEITVPLTDNIGTLELTTQVEAEDVLQIRAKDIPSHTLQLEVTE